ncbi:LemA family protein [Soonwooa sp.]|uniref:LemA family protein n=1 Tax=Soonwooa sp. TaxID=1938592 RepID=UPI0026090E04|nr:LemA family protein [Soonwooa sp.]
MNEEILFYIIIAVVIILIIAFIIGIFNKIIFLKNNVDKSFANIDVVLKQRTDEVPNLVAVVKEAKNYEATTLEKLTTLRSQYQNTASTEDKVKLTNQFEKTLKSILIIAENYPTLTANNNFMALQQRLTELENIIADRREYYNDSVNLYNIGIQEFPNLIMAKVFSFKKKTMLEVTEQEKKYDGIKF